MSASRRRFLRNGMTLGSGLCAPALSSGAPTNETLRTISSLRTIHGDFADRQIPDADIEQILAASVRAANASAMQSYSIVLVRDPEAQRKICGYRGSGLLLYLSTPDERESTLPATWRRS